MADEAVVHLWALLGLIALVGLAIGGALNGLIEGVPDGVPIRSCWSRPRNSPVAMLRTSIERPRHWLVAGANSATWLLLAWWAMGPGDQGSLVPLLLVLGSCGVVLAMIDIEHHRLPNAIVLPLYPITIAGLVLAGALSWSWPWAGCIVGAVVWVAVLGVLWVVSRGRGMGMGDVKLAPVLGATLGWVGVGCALTGLFAAFVLGAIAGLVLMAARKAGRRSRMAFGPYLLAGAVVGLISGQSVFAWYLGAVGS